MRKWIHVRTMEMMLHILELWRWKKCACIIELVIQQFPSGRAAKTQKTNIICGTKPFDKSFVIKHRILYLTFQLKMDWRYKPWLVYFVCFIHVTHNYVMQLQLYYYYYYYWKIGVCSNHRLMPNRKFIKFNKHFNEELCSIRNRCLEIVRAVLLMEKTNLSWAEK